MKILDGNTACSEIAYLFSEVCAIYPITPSSPMAENIDLMVSKGEKNFLNSTPSVVEMESEAGAAGAMHGALLSGSLATTFTASQGLLLMIPNMYKMAGEELPGVIHVASRSLATHALSIFGDHQDIYAARQTGFCILASSSVEDARNMAAVAHLSAIKGGLPFIHFFDGFRTSHEINTISDIDKEKIIKLIDHDALSEFRKRTLNIGNNITYGTNQNDDIYFQCAEAKNTKYSQAADIVNEYMEKINNITQKEYKPFNYYGHKDAKNVIVAMGSVCDTIRQVVDYENKCGNKLGMVEVHLYRPFSKSYLVNVLPKSVEKIAVLDRAKEQGSIGEPLYLDVLCALKDTGIKICGGRYGLSSKNTTPKDIKAVYTMLEGTLKDSFTIGIEDDVTHLSLEESEYEFKNKYDEYKIYGLGSDGMVSASKDMLHIIGENLNKYVQGYFEYDSKKSGGITISHLRVSNSPINAPYYVNRPSIVLVTKDEYFNKFDIIDEIKNNSYLLVNTIKNEKEFNDFLSDELKQKILDKKLSVNIINAEKIAYKNNIPGKINKIMEVAFLKLIGLNDAVDLVIDSIKKVLSKKGESVVNDNINAVNESLTSIKKVTISLQGKNSIKDSKNIYEKILAREGYSIPVSEAAMISKGCIPGGLTKFEKRNVSSLTAVWNFDKCIECGMCTVVCPHAAIRAYAGKDLDSNKDLIGKQDYKYKIEISKEDCLGCSLCANICPTKTISMIENATNTSDFTKNSEQLFNKFTLKGIQFETPKFEFSGACAGCGETPYIKMLTQLYGDEIVIANATGCSSIYGAALPSTPYSLPWANSLFEDNAEFAMGINESYKQKRKEIINTLDNMDLTSEERGLVDKYIENYQDKETCDNILKCEKMVAKLGNLKDYVAPRTVWAIGGDGWAYDIGYNGIDHLLHSGENVKILILDTEVYSNTGGQMSKSTRQGAVAKFANFGKRTAKKDLFRIAKEIDNVYVASVSLGANMPNTINVFKKAEEHNGPALIIAYSPCIEHGIKKGMSCSISEEKQAVDCGYVILMESLNGDLKINSKEPNFDSYEEFLKNENRYAQLASKDPELAKKLLDIQKNNAVKRYNYYKNIAKNS